MGIIQPYLQDFVLGNRDWEQIAIEAVRDMALRAVTLPEDLRKYLTRANRGEGEIRVKGLSRGGASSSTPAVRQLIYAAIGIAAGLGGPPAPLAGQGAMARYSLDGAGARACSSSRASCFHAASAVFILRSCPCVSSTVATTCRSRKGSSSLDERWSATSA